MAIPMESTDSRLTKSKKKFFLLHAYACAYENGHDATTQAKYGIVYSIQYSLVPRPHPLAVGSRDETKYGNYRKYIHVHTANR